MKTLYTKHVLGSNPFLVFVHSVSTTVSKGALWGVGKVVNEKAVTCSDLDVCLPLAVVILVAEAHPTVHLVGSSVRAGE